MDANANQWKSENVTKIKQKKLFIFILCFVLKVKIVCIYLWAGSPEHYSINVAGMNAKLKCYDYCIQVGFMDLDVKMDAICEECWIDILPLLEEYFCLEFTAYYFFNK